MDNLTFIDNLIKTLAWPITILVISFVFKKPIFKLIQFISKIKYKDFEIFFKEEIQNLKMEALTDEISSIEEMPDRKEERHIRKHPANAVIKAWEDLRMTMYVKLKELLPKDSIQYKRLTISRAYTEMSLLGVITPRIKKIIANLRRLRNDLMHYHDDKAISAEDALEYVLLAKRIQKKVAGLIELPVIKLTPFTLLILEINHLLDMGIYDNITLDDIKEKIEDGSLFEYLQKIAKNDIDLSLFISDSPYPGFKDFYIDYLQRICNAHSGNEERKWGISNKGLCLLLAWTNEIVQQGSGWHPSGE